MNKEQRKKQNELQTRREFFKKAAKNTLPILSTMLFVCAPTIMKAKEVAPQWCRFGCAGFCAGQCYATCFGSCYTTCSGCVGFCKVQCIGCTGTCHATCLNACVQSCHILCASEAVSE